MTRVDLDQLAELEEERRFLLRSLADLEREHDAGDIDDADYATLRDGYTVRAAAVLREIDGGRAQLPPKPTAPVGADRRDLSRWSWRRRSASGSPSPPRGVSARAVRRSPVSRRETTLACCSPTPARR